MTEQHARGDLVMAVVAGEVGVVLVLGDRLAEVLFDRPIEIEAAFVDQFHDQRRERFMKRS